MRPAGYLVNTKDGLHGARGSFFDYVLAENGVFIEAEGPHFAARVPVAPANIRGLAPLEPQLVLRHGLIPQHLFDLGLSTMLVDPRREQYVAVTWNDGYHVYVPPQEAGAASTRYLVADNTVLDLHSHGGIGAFFSHTDNADELGLKIYAVCGKLPEVPEIRLRVGVYGYFHSISWDQVFEGNLVGVTWLRENAPADADYPSQQDIEVNGDEGITRRLAVHLRGFWPRFK